jgi:hypothetical protein
LEFTFNFGAHDANFLGFIEANTKGHFGVNVLGQFAKFLGDNRFLGWVFLCIYNEYDSLRSLVLLLPEYTLALSATKILILIESYEESDMEIVEFFIDYVESFGFLCIEVDFLVHYVVN